MHACRICEKSFLIVYIYEHTLTYVFQLFDIIINKYRNIEIYSIKVHVDVQQKLIWKKQKINKFTRETKIDTTFQIQSRNIRSYMEDLQFQARAKALPGGAHGRVAACIGRKIYSTAILASSGEARATERRKSTRGT